MSHGPGAPAAPPEPAVPAAPPEPGVPPLPFPPTPLGHRRWYRPPRRPLRFPRRPAPAPVPHRRLPEPPEPRCPPVAAAPPAPVGPLPPVAPPPALPPVAVPIPAGAEASPGRRPHAAAAPGRRLPPARQCFLPFPPVHQIHVSSPPVSAPPHPTIMAAKIGPAIRNVFLKPGAVCCTKVSLAQVGAGLSRDADGDHTGSAGGRRFVEGKVRPAAAMTAKRHACAPRTTSILRARYRRPANWWRQPPKMVRSSTSARGQRSASGAAICVTIQTLPSAAGTSGGPWVESNEAVVSGTARCTAPHERWQGDERECSPGRPRW